MPYAPVAVLDEARIQRVEEALCRVLGVPGIREYQRCAGQNMLKGMHTILDILAGGGKTLAFWYVLFYLWIPESRTENLRKVIMVIRPLVALLELQAAALRSKGIPAIAVTGKTEHLADMLKVRTSLATALRNSKKTVRTSEAINTVSCFLVPRWETPRASKSTFSRTRNSQTT